MNIQGIFQAQPNGVIFFVYMGYVCVWLSVGN